MSSSAKHVFLSYCHENTAEVATLRQDLVNAGETVWWDKDLVPGSDLRLEIRKAQKSSYAVVLCLSRESESRIRSGIYPEIMDAIAAYRDYAPGGIYLIPVRLSDCEIPLIGIDATRTLADLLYVDLFPPSVRSDGVDRLIKAIRSTRLHP